MPGVQVGFWKDLLELLRRLCMGEAEWEAKESEGGQKRGYGAHRQDRRLAKRQRQREWQASLREARQAAGEGTASADPQQPPTGKRKGTYVAVAASYTLHGQTRPLHLALLLWR